MDRRGNDDLWVMQTTYIIYQVGLACWNKYQNMQSTDSFVCQLTVFSGHKEGIMFRFWFPIQIAYFLVVQLDPARYKRAGPSWLRWGMK